MQLFRKEIVPLGTHVVSDKQGNRREVTITEERARKWIKQFHKMKSEGLGVFAPWEHDFDNKPVESVSDLLNAKNNGGEWVNLTLENGSLWGDIAPATEKDAEAIGSKVKGCSIFVDDYEDGKGRKWEDSILHICLTNKPVAVTGNYTSIAMSTAVEKEKTSDPSVISKVLETLKRIGISLPACDDPFELLKFITIALDNSPLGEGGSSRIPNSVTPKAPRLDLVMSTETQEPEAKKEEKSPLETKILEQNEALKADNQKLSEKLVTFNAFFKKQAQNEVKSQIDQLAASFKEDDKEGQDLVKSLRKQLESTEFSFDENGDVVKTPLHSEIALHLKYAGKRQEKKVPENSDKKPSNVTEKEVEEEPNDDPRYIDPSKVTEFIHLMPL